MIAYFFPGWRSPGAPIQEGITRPHPTERLEAVLRCWDRRPLLLGPAHWVARVPVELLAEPAAIVVELARAGATARRHQDLDALDAWRDAVAISDIFQLKRFLRGLQDDRDAVTNAFLSTLSNDPTEDHVHRIKLISRWLQSHRCRPPTSHP